MILLIMCDMLPCEAITKVISNPQGSEDTLLAASQVSIRRRYLYSPGILSRFVNLTHCKTVFNVRVYAVVIKIR